MAHSKKTSPTTWIVLATRLDPLYCLQPLMIDCVNPSLSVTYPLYPLISVLVESISLQGLFFPGLRLIQFTYHIRPGQPLGAGEVSVANKTFATSRIFVDTWGNLGRKEIHPICIDSADKRDRRNSPSRE